MAEFAYNNAKNANISHMPFKLNCGYYPCVFFEENTNPCFQLKTAKELSSKLRELIIIYQKNFDYAQELQKQVHDKGVKLRNYALSDKIWLNSKYLKTKRNQKLETKFFGPFWVLHPVDKQAYKLQLPKKWRIYNVFHVSLLGQDTTKKEWVKKVRELDAGDNSKEYKVEAIWNSAVYANKSELGHLLGLYYLVA